MILLRVALLTVHQYSTQRKHRCELHTRLRHVPNTIPEMEYAVNLG